MLWDIRARMKPALSIIDLIPHVHRTPALAALRRAVVEGRPPTLGLAEEDRHLAFHEASVALTSPIGAGVLKSLYIGGHLKLKKPGVKPVPALDAYIATEPAFRADVAAILAADTAYRQRLADIIANPSLARETDLTPALIDRVMSAHLGHTAHGAFKIGGVTCHRAIRQPVDDQTHRWRGEATTICWWIDSHGTRQGDPD